MVVVVMMTPWRWVVHDHDQVAGNYAADLLPNMLGKKKGFPIGTDGPTNPPTTHTPTPPHLPTFLPAASRVVAEALSSTVLWCCG